MDLIYKHYPNSIKESKYDSSIVEDEVFDIQFTIYVPEEGVDSIHLPYDTKYNTPERVQLSEFDIWNYRAKKENRTTAKITVTILTGLF